MVFLNLRLSDIEDFFNKINGKKLHSVPAGRREFKPVETMNLVVDESGRLQSLGCN